MLKEKKNCQLFNMKMPMEKLEKNKINIFTFFLLHTSLGFFVVILLIPCIKLYLFLIILRIKINKNIDCHESQNKIYDYIYLFFLCFTLFLYLILLNIDPGRRLKNSQDSFLVNLFNKFKKLKFN